MTDTQLIKPKNKIPTPITQALLAGSFASGVSFVLGVPAEHIPRIAVAGASYSLWLSWQESRLKTTPNKKKRRQIPFSYGNGSSKIDMEFSTSTGGYVTRETYFQGLWRIVFGTPKLTPGPIKSVSRPSILDEFVFTSNYKGQTVELFGKHVKLFLGDAWKNKNNGAGLSRRRWDRDRLKRPAWFRELSPVWYFGMLMLLRNAQKELNIQMVIKTGHQWYSLAIEPRELYGCLKWYEYQIRK